MQLPLGRAADLLMGLQRHAFARVAPETLATAALLLAHVQAGHAVARQCSGMYGLL